MLGIIGAFSDEVLSLIQKLEQRRKIMLGHNKFYKGRIYGKDVVAAISGIGKVNAAMTTAQMLTRFKHIEGIINIGVAGGVGEKVAKGDIVIAEACVQHDVILPDSQIAPGSFLYSYKSDNDYLDAYIRILENKKMPYHKGIIVTGDEFVSNKQKVLRLRDIYNAAACDMESAAIAQVCERMNKKFISTRSISDNADDNADEDFNAWAIKAAEKSISCVCDFIKLHG